MIDGEDEVEVQVGGVKVPMLVDSGCASNIIDKMTWELMKAIGVKLLGFEEKVDKVFKAFGSKQPMRALGSFVAEAKIGGKQAPIKFFILDVQDKCLLGAKSAKEFGVLDVGLKNVSVAKVFS